MGLINSILTRFGVKQNEPLKPDQKEAFLEALKYGYNIFARPTAGSGYLIRTKEDEKDSKKLAPTSEDKPVEGSTSEPQPEEQGQKLAHNTATKNYFEVTPILFEEFSTNTDFVIEEMPDFDQALRIYFENLIISGEQTKEKQNFEGQIWKKYENIKDDQESRMKAINENIDDFYIKAQLIENNISEIQAIIEIINSLIEIGMTSIIKGVLSQARKMGDPLANIIKDYNITDRKVSVFLGFEDELEDTMKVVDIDITKTPFENARIYYELRSSNIEKGKKTLEATNVALKNAKDAVEKKIKKKEDQVKAVKVNRKQLWYEKFYWFISSENYLVASARDAHQNETLIKKYLAKDDIIFHTQVQGSAFSLVKNPRGGPIPHQTLQEAALATLCHSRCWDQKVVEEVFWVYAEQVSKTAPTGQFVGLGSFMIYGKKNFISPARLEMGFGLVFKVEEESIKNHEGERKRRDEGNEITEEDPERLINKSLNLKSPELPERSKATPKLEPKNDQNIEETKEDDAGSMEGQADGDSDGVGQTVEGESTMRASTLSYAREFTIGKDTEVTYAGKTISSRPKQKTVGQQKRQDKKDAKGKDNGKKGGQAGDKGQLAPKKAIETVEVKKSQQLTTKKKKRIEKMMDRYGDMDEDERILQMEMMGAKPLKLTKEQQKKIENKLKEKAGDKIEQEAIKDEEQQSGEEDNDPDEYVSSKKLKAAKKADKNEGKAGNKNQKGKNDQSAKGDKAGQGKAQAGKNAPTKPKGAAKKESEIPQVSQNEVQEKTQTPQESSTIPTLAENKPNESAIQEEPGQEEELEDLPDNEDDQEDEVMDEEKEAKKETMSVLNTVLDEEGEKNINETLEFRDITGIPKNNDALLECVPVCAPYSSMVGYKYRVKLLPGTQKKGKAARQALTYFQSLKEATMLEKGLIKGIEENYAIAQILGNVKIQGSGVTKAKVNEKASKKAAAKKRDLEKQK